MHIPMLLILLLIPIVSSAGPFGIEKGDTKNDPKFANFTALNGEENYLYGKNPPKPHSSFEAYIVRFSSSTGACWVKAIGKDIDADNFGIRTKVELEKISDQIKKKYGNYEKTDRLFSGSIWDDPDDWMMGLYKNERFLMYEWNSKTSSTVAEYDLKSIYAAAKAKDSSDGYVIAEFYFTNHDQCEAEEDKQGEDAF